MKKIWICTFTIFLVMVIILNINIIFVKEHHAVETIFEEIEAYATDTEGTSGKYKYNCFVGEIGLPNDEKRAKDRWCGDCLGHKVLITDSGDCRVTRP